MKWITREKIKVDRFACPWLIKKFVARDAEFVFLPHDTDWARISNGIVFDVPDCELGHHGEDVSFNSIMKNTSSTIRRSFCWARLCARLIRIPPIRTRLEKVCAGSPVASEHSD
jgi:hypothetical protein